MEQRSPEWRRARIGIPTASSFEKIITPAGSPSGQAQGYLCRLLTERLFNRSLEERFINKWMQHGIDMEDEAAREFERVSNERVTEVGFVSSKDGRWGCSPDRLVAGKNAAVEIKCPAPWNHIEYAIYGPGKDYKPQVQGQMLVGGYDFVYFFSYFPGMPSCIVKTERDDSFIIKLENALTVFSDHLDKKTIEFTELDGIDYEVALNTIAKLMPEE